MYKESKHNKRLSGIKKCIKIAGLDADLRMQGIRKAALWGCVDAIEIRKSCVAIMKTGVVAQHTYNELAFLHMAVTSDQGHRGHRSNAFPC